MRRIPILLGLSALGANVGNWVFLIDEGKALGAMVGRVVDGSKVGAAVVSMNPG